MQNLFLTTIMLTALNLNLTWGQGEVLDAEGPVKASLYFMKNTKILPSGSGFNGIRFENQDEPLGSFSPSAGSDPPTLGIEQIRIGDVKILNHVYNDLDDLWIRKVSGSQDIQMMRIGQQISAINTQDLFLSARVYMSFPSGSTGQSGLRLTNLGSNLNYWNIYVSNSNGNLEFSYKGTIKGKIQSSNGAYVTGSDRRLKTSISALPAVLDKIMLLQPRKYRFKDDPTKKESIGFIAQEVAAYFPELVSSLGENEDYLGLNYQHFSVLAIKAIQELNQQNTNLLRLVSKHEKRLCELENQRIKIHRKRSRNKD